MNSQQNAKQHLLIIITIVIGFSFFMMGYSFSPFLEVGFGEGQGVESGVDAGSGADIEEQYKNLYKTDDE